MLPKIIDRLTIISERVRGLDVTSIMRYKEAGLDPAVSNWYSPSGDKYLFNALKQLGITNQGSIIDVGCGKGSAMIMMLKFPFSRVDGLELSSSLARIARRNLDRLKVPISRSQAFSVDARTAGYNEYNMVYFYNPFPCDAMAQVLHNISYSLTTNPRKLTIIYNNPTCHEAVVAIGVFHKVAEYPNRWGTGIYVYSNEA